MDPTAVSPDSFNFITLFLRATWVAKLVMIGLTLASLWSWAVILDKSVRFAKLNREANEFENDLASGRSMEQIAAGKGRGPKPFMAAGSKASAPTAIWHSNRAKGSKAPRAAAKLRAATSSRKTAKVAAEAMPRFFPPQLCKTLSRPPQGDDWAHEIKFDGYRMQLRVEDGVATMRTRNEAFDAIDLQACDLLQRW